MLNLFTVNNNKIGITFGDAIGLVIKGFFVYIFFNIGLVLFSIFNLNKKAKQLDKEDEDNRNASLRLKLIEKTLINQYGRSFEKLLTSQVKKDIRRYLSQILELSLQVKEGKLSEESANTKFREYMQNNAFEAMKAIIEHNRYNTISLDSNYWLYLYNKLGFTWLKSPWNGYDKTSNNKVVILKETELAEEKYQRYCEKVMPKEYKDLYSNAEESWIFLNHMRILNETVKEILIEHPEYISVCPIKI